MSDHPLWTFATDCYRRPGVADACIALQDREGADANMLLCACWLAAEHCRWTPEAVAELNAGVSSWRRDCIEPLRGVRRALKHAADADTLYRDALALEIATERHEQNRLWDYCAGRRRDWASPAPREDLLRDNLSVYLLTLPGMDAARAEPLLTDTLAPLARALAEIVAADDDGE